MGTGTGTSLAVNTNGDAAGPGGGRRGLVMTFKEMKEFAADAANSGMFGSYTPEAAFTLMMLCDAEGIHPAHALMQFDLVEGKPAIRRDALLAKFQDAGGRWRKVVHTDKECTYEFWHQAHCPEPIRIGFTMKQLCDRGVATYWNKRANGGAGELQIKPNYLSYPEDMLWSRVAARGVKRIMPGLAVGIYTREEQEDIEFDRRHGRGPVIEGKYTEAIEAEPAEPTAAAAPPPPPLGGRPGPAALGHDAGEPDHAEKPATQRGGDAPSASPTAPLPAADPRSGIPEPADPAARFDPADFPEPPDVPGEVGRRQVDQFHWLSAINRDMADTAILASIRRRDPAGKASHIEELAPEKAADLIRALAERAWKRNYWHESAIGDTVREDFPGLIPEAVEYATKGDPTEVLGAIMDTLGGGTGGAEPVAEDAPTPVEPPAGPGPGPYVMPEMVRDEPKGRKPRKPKAEAEAEPEPAAIESQV